MPITVIKLGGSLLQSSSLKSWLDNIRQLALTSPVVIVPGGGVFADNVRKLQERYSFNDETAHRMALLAMSQYGYLLKGLNPDFQLVEDIGKFPSAFGQNLPLIWLPDCLMNDFSEVPASWDFTSDSIALWLAIKLNAERIFLVKSIDMDKNNGIQALLEQGKIDEGFQSLIKNFAGALYWLTNDQYDCLGSATQTNLVSRIIVT